MAEPDDRTDMMLRLLRDIRGTLDDHTRRLKVIDRRIDEMHGTMYSSLGLAGHANVRHDTAAERFDEIDARLRKLEEKAGAD